MAKERDVYLDTMEDLIGHPGWRILEDEFRKRIYQCQADALDKAVAKTWDDICYLRGQAEQLAELLRLPDILAASREQYNEDEKFESGE